LKWTWRKMIWYLWHSKTTTTSAMLMPRWFDICDTSFLPWFSLLDILLSQGKKISYYFNHALLCITSTHIICLSCYRHLGDERLLSWNRKAGGHSWSFGIKARRVLRLPLTLPCSPNSQTKHNNNNNNNNNLYIWW
jgi:peptidoglycan/LPS O-acetylase OafA/YrhL